MVNEELAMQRKAYLSTGTILVVSLAGLGRDLQQAVTHTRAGTKSIMQAGKAVNPKSGKSEKHNCEATEGTNSE